VLEHVDNIYTELGGDVLGVMRDRPSGDREGSANREAALVEMLIQMRAEARKSKDFARADEIRRRLADIGVALEDGPKGTSYRIM
jgi:cysteinyl-tRNA synthetase